MSEFFLQLSAIFISWISVIVVTYFAVQWCCYQGMSWKKIGSWVGSIVIGIVLTVAMYYLVPQRYQDMFNVIAHQLACAAAVQVLLLRIDAYVRLKDHHPLSDIKLYGGIVLLYFLMGINSLIIIKLDSHMIVEISHIAVSYITRASILLCLVLEMKMRHMYLDTALQDQDDFFD